MGPKPFGLPAALPAKGQMKSDCIHESIDFPKYHRKNMTDFCPESIFRLGMLCTLLSRVSLRIIKTNHLYLVYKTFQGTNISIFFCGILENRGFHKFILTSSDILINQIFQKLTWAYETIFDAYKALRIFSTKSDLFPIPFGLLCQGKM